jgi:CO/xanthine dehydrogenase Mo-binding subunit
MARSSAAVSPARRTVATGSRSAEAELPYSIGQLVPYETPTEYDSGDYHACFDRCLDEFGWAKKSPSLADNLLPLATDFPNVRGVTLELRPSPTNPLGAKGAGEGGIICVGGVIANAVANALAAFGVEPRELPLTPPRIWQLIQDARAVR